MTQTAPNVEAATVSLEPCYSSNGRLAYFIIWLSSGGVGGFVFLKWRGHVLIKELLERERITEDEHDWLAEHIKRSNLLER